MDADAVVGDTSSARPSVRVAVVMEREAQPNRWEDWRFRLVDVVPDEVGRRGGSA